MANEKILIIEDNIDLSNGIRDFLTVEAYQVSQAFTGAEGVELVESINPDLVILDIMLPGMDGINVCKKIRETKVLPILIISAKASDYDKVLALGVGADDYLTKPFSMIELVARVKSHLRRATQFVAAPSIHKKSKEFPNLVIHSDFFEVIANGTKLEFSPKEFMLLDFLSDSPNQVFTKQQLIDQVWGYSEFIDDNTIAVYIGRIREKLSKAKIEYIKTVWGVGYKWES
ncbi:MAG: response regulator transcription factor [bacterium]|nr:response regulator transcription factor [bacterium]